MNKFNETNCLSKALYKSKLLETKWTQYSGLIYIYGINFDCLLVKCTVCLRGLVNIYLTRLRKSGIVSWTYCTTRVQKYNIQNLYMYVYFIYFILRQIQKKTHGPSCQSLVLRIRIQIGLQIKIGSRIRIELRTQIGLRI